MSVYLPQKGYNNKMGYTIIKFLCSHLKEPFAAFACPDAVVLACGIVPAHGAQHGWRRRVAWRRPAGTAARGGGSGGGGVADAVTQNNIAFNTEHRT